MTMRPLPKLRLRLFIIPFLKVKAGLGSREPMGNPLPILSGVSRYCLGVIGLLRNVMGNRRHESKSGGDHDRRGRTTGILLTAIAL